MNGQFGQFFWAKQCLIAIRYAKPNQAKVYGLVILALRAGRKKKLKSTWYKTLENGVGLFLVRIALMSQYGTSRRYALGADHKSAAHLQVKCMMWLVNFDQSLQVFWLNVWPLREDRSENFRLIIACNAFLMIWLLFFFYIFYFDLNSTRFTATFVMRIWFC